MITTLLGHGGLVSCSSLLCVVPFPSVVKKDTPLNSIWDMEVSYNLINYIKTLLTAWKRKFLMRLFGNCEIEDAPELNNHRVK